MSADYEFRPDLKELARRDFLRAQHIERGLSPKQIRRDRMANAVKRSVKGVEKKLDKHFEKNKERWIAREVEKLKRERPERLAHALVRGPKPPPGASYSRHVQGGNTYARARANVEARMQRRKGTLKKIENRMTQQLTRNRSRSR